MRVNRGTARRSVAGWSFFLWAALPFSSLSAQQPPDRLDPVLREALRPAARAGLERLPRPQDLVAGQDPRAPGALAVRVERDGVTRIGVFVRLENRSGLDAIRAAGGIVDTELGDIVTARIPIEGLASLGTAPGIGFVEAARAVAVEHDTSMIVISATEIRTRVGEEWSGATGDGALVAIYDSGIDLLHPDFRDADGRSRVVAAWDQTSSGNPPPGFTQGFVCDSTAIANYVERNTSSACPLRDFTGHGTHVAGSAAGDGSATGNGLPAFRYTGVAPGAKLISVKGGNNSFFENLIVDGLTWIKQEAQRLRRPVVVNLSLGGQFGAHDGSRLYEQAIDQLSGPGFIVVISAGNNGVNRNTDPILGGRLLHARGFATGTATTTFTMSLAQHTPNPDLCNGNITQMGLWYSGSDRLRVEVVRPNGTSLAAPFSRSLTQDDATGRIAIDNGSGGVDPRNGDYGVQIRVDGCGTSGAPAAGNWQVRVTPEAAGSGRPIDLWVEVSSHGNTIPGTPMLGEQGFDNRFVVGSPGNATRAITVAAFATRMCWPSQTSSGTSCYVQREQIGDLARFSSGGPRRDGMRKPDIAAPGIGIMSARAGSAGFGASRAEPDGVHGVLEGTSMSAPHVTGSIAVLFQVKPDLTPEEARSILDASAVQDAFTLRTFDAAGSPVDWWGAGKLHVQNALLALTGTGPAVLALSTEPAIPSQPTLAKRGTRLPLLALRLSSQGTEAIDVLSLSFKARGTDPGAWLVLMHDANRDGRLNAGDVPLDSVQASLSGPERTFDIDLAAGKLRVPALGSTGVLVTLSLSGNAPNGATFHASFVPAETESIGLRSGERNQLVVAPSSLESGPARTTLLADEELLTFSANPVRRDHVIFNFAEPPTTAAVYTMTGRRVIDLVTDGALNVRWDLNNDEGGRVAPGVYLVVFTVRGEVFREKLVVLTPGRPVP